MTIGAVLDKRRMLKNGRFPVKIRIMVKQGSRWVQAYYPTGYSLTEAIWEKVKGEPRSKDLRAIRHGIFTREAEAVKIYRDNPFISLDGFDALFTGRQTQSLRLQDLFEEVIARQEKNEQVGTSRGYRNALDSILGFKAGLSLQDVTTNFLQDYEAYMRKLGRSPSTIGIYLRNLRTVFNLAIDRKLIARELYPFGRKGYVIPSSVGIKRALTEEQKAKLVAYHPRNADERLALEHWRFSYYCYGMNFTDMAYLTRDNIHGDVLTYIRRKTTGERNSVTKSVPLRAEVLAILKKSKGKTIFGIIDLDDDAFVRKDKITSWILKTDGLLKRIAKRLKIPPVTTYTARHTMATMMLRNGSNIVAIRDALGHSSIQTTENYLKSLDLEGQRQEIAKL